MKHCINLASDPWSLAEFDTAGDLRAFYERFGCDGIEIILCGDGYEDKILSGMVRGLHFVFYPEWIALWQDDYAYLDRVFGSRTAWQEFYSAKSGAELLEIYKKELLTAEKLGAEYVVFHIGDNPLEEFYTLKQRRSDAEIIRHSADFLNCLFDGKTATCKLLLENMWLGAMNLTNPDTTHEMLSAVKYENTGLMLDTGHLMVTNPHLRDAEQACGYIHKILDMHTDILSKICGVHLHQSLSGEYFSSFERTCGHLRGTYIEKYMCTGKHLSKIDPHNPFIAKGLPALIERISPEFLVYELSRRDMQSWEERLLAQKAVFDKF